MWIPVIVIFAVVVIFYIAAGAINASIVTGVGNIYREMDAVEMAETQKEE